MTTVAYFKHLIEQYPIADDTSRAKRVLAKERFAEWGLPKKGDEEWKYTPVWNHLGAFTLASDMKAALQPDDFPLPQNARFCFVDGVLQHKPAGDVSYAKTWADLAQHAPQMLSVFGSVLEDKHGIHAANTVLAQTGLYLDLNLNFPDEKPIVLHHHSAEEASTTQLRHVIHLAKGVRARVIELFSSEAVPGWFNGVSEIILEEGSSLTYYAINLQAKSFVHTHHVAVKQHQNSQFEAHSVSLGAKIARSDIDIRFTEENARCTLNAVYLPGTGQHVDHHSSIYHDVGHCHSEQDYKGVVIADGHAVFNGKVIVAPNAFKTEAHQSNKNLILERKGMVDTKPELQIFADDVVCSHGATIGQLDEDALFYLTSRGLAKAQAVRMLVEGFAHQNIAAIPDVAIRAFLSDAILKQLQEG